MSKSNFKRHTTVLTRSQSPVPQFSQGTPARLIAINPGTQLHNQLVQKLIFNKFESLSLFLGLQSMPSVNQSSTQAILQPNVGVQSGCLCRLWWESYMRYLFSHKGIRDCPNFKQFKISQETKIPKQFPAKSTQQ